MKLLPHYGLGAGAALLLGLASCQSHAKHARDHWTGYSVGPRLSRAFLSYDPETDGQYRDFQWRKKKNIELTLRRHFFNHNPDNPFQPVDPKIYEPRPVHSPLPAPWRYIHVEGLVFGALAMAGGGVFVPVPVDSLIGTADEGGSEEAWQGVGTFFRPAGQATASFMHDAIGLPETKGDAWRREPEPKPREPSSW
jgi:hypothetical protein